MNDGHYQLLYPGSAGHRKGPKRPAASPGHNPFSPRLCLPDNTPIPYRLARSPTLIRAPRSRTIGGNNTTVTERPTPMPQFFRIQVDTEALTDAAFAFVTDPHASRNERPVILELNEFNPEVVDVLECMVMDGTEERQDVAAYITAVFAS